MTASNMLSFADLLDAKGDLSSLADDVSQLFAEMGDISGEAQVASERANDAQRRTFLLASTAYHAYETFAGAGIDVDPSTWISCIAFGQLKPEKGDAAGIALQTKLTRYNEVLNRVVLEPAMRAWVHRKDMAHPDTHALYNNGQLVRDSAGNAVYHLGFSAVLALGDTTKPADMSPNDKARYEGAKQMRDNARSNLRKLAALAPIMNRIDDRLSAKDSPLSGALGMNKLASALRQRIDLRVRGGKMFTIADAVDAVTELTTKVSAETPTRDKADKLASAMRAAADNLAKHIVAHKDTQALADSFSKADLDTVNKLCATLDALGFFAKGEVDAGTKHAFPFREDYQDADGNVTSDPVVSAPADSETGGETKETTEETEETE
jgi:hypothetical protein